MSFCANPAFVLLDDCQTKSLDEIAEIDRTVRWRRRHRVKLEHQSEYHAAARLIPV
jgi:hypothetical protein